MEKSIKLFAGALMASTLLFASCKKSSPSPSPKPTTPTSSQWIVDGVTYNGSETTFTPNATNYFESSSSAPNDSQVQISFGSKPASTSSYTVISYESFLQNGKSTNQCVLTFIRSSDNGDPFLCTGAAGNTVNVTVNSAGKITAVFSKISLMDNNGVTSTTISGALVQP